MSEPTVRQAVRPFRRHTAGLRGWTAIDLVLAAVRPMLVGAALWLTLVLVDEVVVAGRMSLLPTVVGGLLALAVLAAVIEYADTRISTWLTESVALAVRTAVFRHLHRLSSEFFERRPASALSARLSADVSVIGGALVTDRTAVVGHGVRLAVLFGLLVWVDWPLAVAAAVAVSVLVVAARVAARRAHRAELAAERRRAGIADAVEESLTNVALVRAYDRARAEVERVHRAGRDARSAHLAAGRRAALVRPLAGLVGAVVLLAALGLGIWWSAAGALTAGGLVVAAGCLALMVAPVRALVERREAAATAVASADRVVELLDERPTVFTTDTPVPLVQSRGEVRLDGVHYTYPGSDTPALDDVSLHLPAGHTVVVVGPDGASRHALASLLLRFVDPDSGAVLLDDHDLRDLDPADLRRGVAAVLQEALVVDGTIRENIAWGRPDASEAEIVEAALAAGADEFVAALPEGYDTRVGRRGRLLTAGQRQRIAIARAVLRDAPVLLVDEPPAGLDDAEEVLEALRALMADRTTLVVGHALLTVADADQVVYVEDGRVTATGRHHELLARSPGYAELCRVHAPRVEPAPPRPDWVEDVLPAAFRPADPWSETALLPSLGSARPARERATRSGRHAAVEPDTAPTERFGAVSTPAEMPVGAAQGRIAGMGDVRGKNGPER